MQVKLEKTFGIAASSANAWVFLQDIPGVAGCMPGAEITETIDERNFKGKVKAKIGPATMAFNGTIEIKRIDGDKRELELLGQGQDTKGSSSATLELLASVVDTDAGQCEVKGLATVTVTGKAASLGGRMMTQVADQILNQFGKNLTNNVLAMGEGEQSEEARVQLDEQPVELNGLAFAWQVLLGFLRSLFGGKSAKQN